ncbi:MAG: hypothetical protein WBM35_03860 [Candidatus Electrothrix sp.]
MKKITIFCVCTALCMWMTSCVGPGTGPYGAYTSADRYRDTVHTTAAVGAVAVGVSLFGHLLHNNRPYHNRHHYDRRYHNRVYAQHVYYIPVVRRPLPRGYIYR